MARSKARKRKMEKLRQERRMKLLENEIIKGHVARVYAMALDILKDRPPVTQERYATIDEIEEWFERDPEAPLVVCSFQIEENLDVRILPNPYAIERELRQRGIGDEHPDWELTCRLMVPILGDLTREYLEEVMLRVARGELPPEAYGEE